MNHQNQIDLSIRELICRLNGSRYMKKITSTAIKYSHFGKDTLAIQNFVMFRSDNKHYEQKQYRLLGYITTKHNPCNITESIIDLLSPMKRIRKPLSIPK